MFRLFSYVSAVAVLMTVFASAGVYWIGMNQIAQMRHHSSEAIAESTAIAISEHIEILANILEKLAHDQEVLDAVASTDVGRLMSVAAKLEQHVPDILKIRLLLPGVSELDDRNVPRMGFADLDMVRDALTKSPLPAIQGDKGSDRHLAIARRIILNDQVVGVILASFDYGFVNRLIQAVDVKGGYMVLKQGGLALASKGNASGNDDLNNDVSIRVKDSSWDLQYQYPESDSIGDKFSVIGLILLSILLILLMSFVCYRKLSALLNQDLASVLKACKDLLTNKLQGTYPVALSEMSSFISTLVQFKRVFDNQDGYVVEDDKRAASFDIGSFFEESVPAAGGGRKKKDLGVDEVKEPIIRDLEFTKMETQEEQMPREVAEKRTPDYFEMPTANKSPVGMDTIFRAYDIRGVVGKTLTEEVVCNIGRAIATQALEHGCQKIVVGYDGRLSSSLFAEALIEGLINSGVDVVSIGRVPTPVLYFVAYYTPGRSGVMITGSHNPPDYNGLKMVLNGETLAGNKIQQLKACIVNQAYSHGRIGSVEQNSQYCSEYLGNIVERLQIARPMTVVLDCGNGVAGELGPKLLRALGCEVMELFCEIDGTFPNHHPDPSNPKNLKELIASVKQYKADIGIAFDGDGDRLGVVDSSGKIIWPDRQMMLFSKDVLTAKPGAEIIYDVKCSRHLGDQISKFGGKPTMWKTGHSLMKAKLKETGAKLAGEMSGHIFFNDRWLGFDDALYSAARLIEILSRDARTSAEVFADFPDSVNTPELNVVLEEGENINFVTKMLAMAKFENAVITEIDGLRVDFPDGWGLVRASNTTPSLVIRFEADSESSMLRIQTQFKQLMKEIKPDIILPF